MKHMAGCLVLIGVLVLVRVADGIPGWMIGLVLLACPVVMIWMIVSMSRSDGPHDRTTDDHPAER
jgi:hypothetical protein